MESMSQLERPDTPIDINQYDQLCKRLNARFDTRTNEILTNFRKRDDAWTVCDQILDSNLASCTKFNALLIMQDMIKMRWQTLDEGQRSSIRAFIQNTVINWARQSVEASLLNAADLTLVAILLQEWPKVNQGIIVDLVESSQSSTTLLENNLLIILYLCQNSQENNEETLTYLRVNEITNALKEEASVIFPLIKNVLFSSGSSQTLKISLELLKFFVQWIDPQLIVEENLLQMICNNFLTRDDLIFPSLDLISSIFSLKEVPMQIQEVVPSIFTGLVNFLKNEAIKAETSDALRSLVTTLTIFLDRYSPFVEQVQCIAQIEQAVAWLIDISNSEDSEVFRACAEYWLVLARKCWKERTNIQSSIISVYLSFLPPIRRILINRMEKPAEMALIEGQSADKAQQSNTSSAELFKIMREALILYTNLDQIDTISAINDNLSMLSMNFTLTVLNTTCWSAGAISGSLSSENEKAFLTKFINFLLQQIQQQPDVQIRADIAAGILYVCSQYPRFLTSEFSIFKTVISRLFDFMSIEVEGVREIAVESFRTIASKCSKQFVQTNQSQPTPFVSEILSDLPNLTRTLSCDNIVSFVGSLAIIIQKFPREETRNEQLAILMDGLNSEFDSITASFDPSNLDMAQRFLFLMRCNSAVAENPGFQPQLFRILTPMMDNYVQYSSALMAIIQDNSKREEAKLLRTIKSEILMVLINFVNKTQTPKAVSGKLIPMVMECVVNDFGSAHPDTRIPEVLDLLSAMAIKMKDDIGQNIPHIFNTVFYEAVVMIQQDFDSYPAFRLPFYRFLSMIVKNFVTILLSAPAEDFTLFVNCIKWGADHPTHEVCTLSLEMISDLITNISSSPSKNQFLDSFYLDLVAHTFKNIMDTVHKFAFDEQITLLRYLLGISTPQLNASAITTAILSSIGSRNPHELFNYISNLINSSNDEPQFRRIMRDMLVTGKQFSIDDPDLNRLEEQQQNVTIKEDLKMAEGYNGPAPVTE